MFAYCINNPITFLDYTGNEPEEAIDTDDDGEDDCYVYTYTYTVGVLWWETTKTGKVYIYTTVFSEASFDGIDRPNDFNEKTDLLVGDWTQSDNPTIYAYQAQNVSAKHRKEIVDILFEYTADFDRNWNRTKASVMTEWEEHHRYAFASKRAQNIDFDEAEEGKEFWYYLQKAWNAFWG